MVKWYPADLRTANYLVNYRLQWGNPDTLSLLSSDYDPNTKFHDDVNGSIPPMKGLPPLPPDAPKYFTADIAPEYVSVILNDWPYSGVPSFST